MTYQRVENKLALFKQQNKSLEYDLIQIVINTHAKTYYIGTMIKLKTTIFRIKNKKNVICAY